MKKCLLFLTALALCLIPNRSSAQLIFHGSHGPTVTDGGPSKLHVNPRWRECSFQLNEDLSQSEWNEFAKEAGLVIYFRPMVDAKPMGARNFEVSVLQWSTGIDEHKGAWNDTFVHPDSTHWLVGGSNLPIMGLTGRMGLTDRLDVGVYITKNPGANYGFMGVQGQYQLASSRNFNTSVRGSVVRMYGPKDMRLTVYGADVVASREFSIHDKWLRVAPYVVLSTMLSVAHEKSAEVNLSDERVAGLQGSAGIVTKVAAARIGLEYNVARVNTVSMKIGVAF